MNADVFENTLDKQATGGVDETDGDTDVGYYGCWSFY